MDADLVVMHGFWSSQATWDRLIDRLGDDPELTGLRIHAFPYESPKLRWPLSPARIPDYNDIAQSLPAYLATHAPGNTPIAIVTHSQGGLILQRFLAWMLTEGRGRELARIRLAVMLSCPTKARSTCIPSAPSSGSVITLKPANSPSLTARSAKLAGLCYVKSLTLLSLMTAIALSPSTPTLVEPTTSSGANLLRASFPTQKFCRVTTSPSSTLTLQTISPNRP